MRKGDAGTNVSPVGSDVSVPSVFNTTSPGPMRTGHEAWGAPDGGPPGPTMEESTRSTSPPVGSLDTMDLSPDSASTAVTEDQVEPRMDWQEAAQRPVWAVSGGAYTGIGNVSGAKL